MRKRRISMSREGGTSVDCFRKKAQKTKSQSRVGGVEALLICERSTETGKGESKLGFEDWSLESEFEVGV